MMATDEDALICDFAETYHVYDLKSLAVSYAATLAYGLRDDSRIKMKIAGQKVTLDTLLSAYTADTTSWILWSLSGGKGTKKPESIMNKLMKESKKKDTIAFASKEAFDAEWERLTRNAVEVKV